MMAIPASQRGGCTKSPPICSACFIHEPVSSLEQSGFPDPCILLIIGDLRAVPVAGGAA